MISPDFWALADCEAIGPFDVNVVLPILVPDPCGPSSSRQVLVWTGASWRIATLEWWPDYDDWDRDSKPHWWRDGPDKYEILDVTYWQELPPPLKDRS